MIIGIDKIFEHFDIQQKKYFAVFYRNKMQNSIYRNCKIELDKGLAKEDKLEAKKQHDENYTFQQAKESFEKYIYILGPGEYTLVVSDNIDATQRGNSTVDFKILVGESNTNYAVHSVGAVHSTGITTEQAEKIADERFAKLMMETDNKTLKEKVVAAEKEIKELEGKVNKPMTDLIGSIAPHVGPHLGSWLGNFLGAPATIPQLAISGALPSSVGEGDEAQQQQIFQNFVTALSTARPNDWLEIIQKLTVLAADSNKLEMALKFI